MMKIRVGTMLMLAAAWCALVAAQIPMEKSEAEGKRIPSATEIKAMEMESSRVQRTQPQPRNTHLPMAPPPGAVMLFDGTSLEGWSRLNGQPAHWKLADGCIEVVSGGNIRTREEFGDCRLHIEFWLPLMADKTGQARANSGVYLMGRHEVQVLDSYGHPPADNLCGGIYRVATPEASASLPPEQWQSYDIFYTAPKLEEGKMVSPARISVIHNGIRIHHNVEITKPQTGGGLGDNWVEKGPLMLQDHHGDKVRFRNIWYVPGSGTGATLQMAPR